MDKEADKKITQMARELVEEIQKAGYKTREYDYDYDSVHLFVEKNRTVIMVGGQNGFAIDERTRTSRRNKKAR